jgi:hypothetical protein
MKISKTDEAFLRGLHGPKHWSEADAQRALGLYRASGLSRAAFARRHGLRDSRLSWWERRLAASPPGRKRKTKGASRMEADSRFVQLVAAADAAPPHAAATVRVGAVHVEFATLDTAAADFVVALSRAAGGDACS